MMTREAGQSVLIEDVLLTVAKVAPQAVMLSLSKLGGGRESIIALRKHQLVDICYDVKLQVISIEGTAARLAFQYPEDIQVQRWDADSDNGDETVIE